MYGDGVAGGVWRSVLLVLMALIIRFRTLMSDLRSLCSGTMPSNLSKNLTPLGVSSATITKIYGSIKTAKTQPDNIRAAVITGAYISYLYYPILSLIPDAQLVGNTAYDETVRPLYIAALVLGVYTLSALYFPHHPLMFARRSIRAAHRGSTHDELLPWQDTKRSRWEAARHLS